MSRTVVDPPALRAWRRSSPKAGTAQYASLVRGFLKQRLSSTLDDVTEDELVIYCLGQPTKGMLEKVSRALTLFLAFHFSGKATPNPAARLKQRLKDEAENLALLDRLRNAGVTDDVARVVRWRDVAGVAFGTSTSTEIINRLPARQSAVMEFLTDRLLSQLRFMQAADIDVFLDRLLC